ncbi:MAG: arginine--tRNA ligase, partial [Sphingomonadales bacterium]|nr:arginine--tRNA ligase [Sphingomonadales bacterium]
EEADQPLTKADGSSTYFAADIAYHYDKVRRGAEQMIDVWGADHAGHVKRTQLAIDALTGGDVPLDVRVCQMVRLLRGGEPVRMSKRAGSFVTLADLKKEVGRDVIRFIMLTRRNDAPLDFDFDKVLEQSRDNPVFYVQYAHARIQSVRRKAADLFPAADISPEALAEADLARLSHPAELALLKKLAQWPRIVETAALSHEPHRVAFYLNELAGEFHGLWNQGNDDPGLRFLMDGDEALSRARIALITGVRLAIASGLAILGVEPVEEMH